MQRRYLLGLGLAPLYVQQLTGAATAQTGRRVALVIGNGAYGRGIPALANPPRDARAISLSLERLGFQVDLRLDADRTTMLAAFRNLGDRAAGAEAALLFYAGHAAEVAGRNILFPVSVSASRNGSDLVREAVAYDDLSAALNGKAQTTIILLDSCRDNPLTGATVPLPATQGRTLTDGATRSVGTGLASVFSPIGTLIVYATAPGQVALDGDGRNSPFTTALLQHIETPDVEVRDMLTRVRRVVRQNTRGQQVPWDNSSLDAAFFMLTGSSAGASAGPTRRIIDEAAEQDIALPVSVTELRFQRAGATGAGAQLVGSWSSGNRRWGGHSGRRNVLIVLSIDERTGTADTIFAQSAYSEDAGAQNSRSTQGRGSYFQRRVMSLAQGSGTLEFVLGNGERMQFTLISADQILATLRASPDAPRLNPRNNIVAQVRMRRID